MNVELKLCPFCGGTPKLSRRHLDERFAYADEVEIQCQGCGVRHMAHGDWSKPGYADNSTVEQRAIAAWNARTIRNTEQAVAWEYRMDHAHSGSFDPWDRCSREQYDSLRSILAGRETAYVAGIYPYLREDSAGWKVQIRALVVQP